MRLLDTSARAALKANHESPHPTSGSSLFSDQAGAVDVRCDAPGNGPQVCSLRPVLALEALGTPATAEPVAIV